MNEEEERGGGKECVWDFVSRPSHIWDFVSRLSHTRLSHTQSGDLGTRWCLGLDFVCSHRGLG